MLISILLILSLTATTPQLCEARGVRDSAETIRANEIEAIQNAATLAEKLPHAVQYFETTQFDPAHDEAAVAAFLEQFFQIVRDNFTNYSLISVKPDLQSLQRLFALSFAMDHVGGRRTPSTLALIEESLLLAENAAPNSYQRVVLQNRRLAEYLLLLRYNVMAYQTLTSLDPESLGLARRALFPNRLILARIQLEVIQNCTSWIREATRLRALLSQLQVRVILDPPLTRRYRHLYLVAYPGPHARAERKLTDAFDAFAGPMRTTAANDLDDLLAD